MPMQDSPPCLPLSPFGRRIGLTAKFLLFGQRTSRRADTGNTCLMKFLKQEAGYRLPGKANLWHVWTWIYGASSFYLISTAMFYLGSQAKSFSDKLFLLPGLFPQSLGTFRAVPLSFKPLRPFCLPLNQILILTQIECPNTFLFEATNLNIKGSFKDIPSLSWKSYNREEKKGFWSSTHFPGGKKTETVRS